MSLGLCLNRITVKNKVDNFQKFLAKRERDYLEKPNINKEEFIFGRYTAKKSISKILKKDICLNNLIVEKGIFGQPVLKTKSLNLDVSISYMENLCVSIAFPKEIPMGVSIFNLNLLEKSYFVKDDSKSYMMDFTNYTCESSNTSDEELLAIILAAKKAVFKALKINGLTLDVKIAFISSKNDLFNIAFQEIAQYTIKVMKCEEILIAVAYPYNVNINWVPVHKNIKSNLY